MLDAPLVQCTTCHAVRVGEWWVAHADLVFGEQVAYTFCPGCRDRAVALLHEAGRVPARARAAS